MPNDSCFVSFTDSGGRIAFKQNDFVFFLLPTVGQRKKSVGQMSMPNRTKSKSRSLSRM